MKKYPLKYVMSIFLVTAVALTGLSGCSKNVPFLSGPEEPQEKIVTSNEIRIPIDTIQSFNPVNSKEESVYYMNKLIYEGLFELDSTLAAVPVLAESYAFNQDEASVDISLKSGIQWHDGSSFSAEDVKYSIDAYLASYYSNTSLFNNYIGKIKSAKVRGSNSITIYFKSAKDMAVENLTFPILPKGQYKKSENLRKAGKDFNPVGTGPYMITSMDKVKEITLEGFSGYHGAVPTNKMIFKVMTDQNNSTKLFSINDLSISFSKDMNRETFANSKDLNLDSFVSNEMEVVGFNVNRPGLISKDVRKALAAAIDSQEIMDTGYFKNGVLSDSLYYPGYLGIENEAKEGKFDLKKAKKMLEEAGYSDVDGNGFVENSNGDELYLTVLFNTENASRKIAAQVIKENLEKLLIHVTVDEREWNGYNAAIASGDYDLFIGGYRIIEPFDLRFLLHSDYNNPAGYSNMTLNFLLDKMQSGATGDERKEAYQSIKKIVNDDMPYYCMFYKTYGVIASKSLKGNVDTKFYNIYNNCQDWHCEYKETVTK